MRNLFRRVSGNLPVSREERTAPTPSHDPNEIMSPCGFYGWSITVGELRASIAGVPDDYEVMLSNAEVDDCEISNVNINDLYAPFKGAPGLLVLGGGQIVTSEYAYHERMDRSHGEYPEERRGWWLYRNGKRKVGWHQ